MRVNYVTKQFDSAHTIKLNRALTIGRHAGGSRGSAGLSPTKSDCDAHTRVDTTAKQFESRISVATDRLSRGKINRIFLAGDPRRGAHVCVAQHVRAEQPPKSRSGHINLSPGLELLSCLPIKRLSRENDIRGN